MSGSGYVVAKACSRLTQIVFFFILVGWFWSGEWKVASAMDFCAFYSSTFGNLALLALYKLNRSWPLTYQAIAGILNAFVMVTSASSVLDSQSQLSVEYRVILALRTFPLFLGQSVYISILRILIIFSISICISPCALCYAFCSWTQQHRPDFSKLDDIFIQSPQDTPSPCFCLEDTQEGQVIRQLRCQHRFHQACIDPWLQLHPTCPNCRADVFAAPEADIPRDELADNIV